MSVVGQQARMQSRWRFLHKKYSKMSNWNPRKKNEVRIENRPQYNWWILLVGFYCWTVAIGWHFLLEYSTKINISGSIFQFLCYFYLTLLWREDVATSDTLPTGTSATDGTRAKNAQWQNFGKLSHFFTQHCPPLPLEIQDFRFWAALPKNCECFHNCFDWRRNDDMFGKTLRHGQTQLGGCTTSEFISQYKHNVEKVLRWS